MALWTRPVLRDWLRRQLQIVPPSDNGSGPVGAQPSYAPSPTNPQINDCIQNALSTINTYCQIHITQYSQSIPAPSTTTLGPYALNLSNLSGTGISTPGLSNPGVLNDIQRALWDDSGNGTNPQLLLAQSRDAWDRNQYTYYRQPPGNPQFYYIEGLTLYLSPAPSTAGVLSLIAGTGFVGMQGESDPIDQLPIDYQVYVGYETLVGLSLLETMDTEARQRAANFIPLAAQGKALIKAWKDGSSGTVQTALWITNPYRRSYGCRRIRR